MRRPDNKTLILTGVLMVVVVLLTCLLRFDIHHQGELSGYWTLGDVGVYIAAALLGGPWAALASGVGSALADIFVGQAVYAPASLLIKAGMALAFAARLKRGHAPLDLVKSVAVAGGIMIGGYFFYDLIFRGDYVLAAISLPFNILQLIGSGVIAVPVLFLMGGKNYRQGGGFGSRDDFTQTKRQLK
ncbi:MAG TPA: ECF transporter S component [Feifaniaceae bacterium]|nr:ECF transporter S component [Feifaniaceae bacterium]